jgi:hypothetical protein
MSYNPAYKIYKPNMKDHTKGCASSWEWNAKTCNFFLTVAKQEASKDSDGNNRFSWKEDSETVKLDTEEIAEIACVLSGRKAFLGAADESGKGKGFFHQNKSGNVIMKMYKLDDGFAFEISSKKGDQRFWAGHRLTVSEAYVVESICKQIIIKMFVGCQP